MKYIDKFPEILYNTYRGKVEVRIAIDPMRYPFDR